MIEKTQMTFYAMILRMLASILSMFIEDRCLRHSGHSFIRERQQVDEAIKQANNIDKFLIGSK